MKRAIVAAALLGAATLAVWLGRGSDEPPVPKVGGGSRHAPIAPARIATTPSAETGVPRPRIHWPRRRFDKVSVAGAPEPVRVVPGSATAEDSGKPIIVEAPGRLPSEEDLRADQQRRKELRRQGIDTPNPRLERPNAPEPRRPDRPARP